MSMNSAINTAFMRIATRAEAVDPSTLVQTFVDVGPLFSALAGIDHQIVYGRRGTGKTHALVYLAHDVAKKGDIPVYLDMRRVGSTGGIYADPDIPITERATRLLSDTLAELHEKLLEVVLERAEELNLSELGPKLDLLAKALSEVAVTGAIEQEEIHKSASTDERTERSGINVSVKEANVHLQSSQKDSQSFGHEARLKRSGLARHRVHFGSVQQALESITAILKKIRIWLILDEWSVVPLELQPYLADLLRRSVFPIRGITVRIGAIEQRSEFQLLGERGDYVGIELGADASANLNLDDFMVFDNDEERSITFFQELVYKHYLSVVADDLASPRFRNSDEFIQQAFTQRNVFGELVQAAEGVPRDAIHILSITAQKAFREKIAIEHIRMAARAWYQQDKGRVVGAQTEANNLLHHIIDEVIGRRRTRAFLLRSNTRNTLIDALFDARVLHIRKRNISSNEEAGVRYDVYKIDYGCYVDLLTTTRAPKGLLSLGDKDEDARFIEVPPDDYRSIRRAILDLSVLNTPVT